MADEKSHHGEYCWHELMTTDTETCRKFYTQLFGWTTGSMDMGPAGTYTLWKSGGKDVGGMMAMIGDQWKGVPPNWMIYVAVDDIEATARKVNELGGSVIVPPTPIPDVGRFAVIKDPTGAVISLLQGL